ncbi:acyl-CoA dehydrogenase [Sulfolobales archaeon HS-7]|nr:acyl-CoA dehydrogenase [Sulfolobales archaeon HS-7]
MVAPFRDSETFSVTVSEDHELFRRSVREFLERDVMPYVEKGEREGTIPEEVLQSINQMGLTGISIPKEYGGQGGDMLSTVILTEEITRVWPSLAARLGIVSLFSIPILLHGTEEQKKRYIPPVAKGEKTPALANTEPTGGSDVAGMKSLAKRINDHYVINGRKIFITNGGIADYYVVTARTSPPGDKRWKGISMFIVEREMPGVKVVGRIETMGLKSSNTAELAFEEVKVPAENLIGEEGMGFMYAMETFDGSRPGVAAQGLGVAQAAVEKMASYAIQRSAFDAPLISYQMVQEKIAESLTEISAARLLTYWAATLHDKGRKDEAIIASSMAKYFATEVAEKIVLRAISIHGGYGVTTSTGVERLLRDIEIMKIYEGANDIQKLVIIRETARRLLGIKM